MTQDQVLLIVLVVLVVANVFLIATLPIRMRRRQPATGHVSGRARPLGASVGHDDPGPADDARVVAAIETFVSGASADTSTGQHRPPADRAARATPDPERPSIAPQWPLAELGDPAMWSRTIREESARLARFGHPVTVVMAELQHLSGLADRFGRGIADRVTTEAALSLVSESRAVDRIAWLGGARFGVLLSETEENAASAYVERVRAKADGWLESTGLSIRLSLGWASPTEGGDVAGAAITAEQRMHDAERGPRPGPRIVPRAAGSDPSRPPGRPSRG